ncbi:hypothetical protein SKAU_G00042600, partial [Synaphobranchus kaupii]
MSEANVLPPMSLVLVGMSGVGKSAAGNTILGREEFISEASPSSLTLTSKRGIGDVCGRRVTVVDTPGLCNTELSGEKLREEMQRAVTLCDPKPHAVLLVIQLGRFTEQEKRVMETLQELFSNGVNEYTVVLFTYGDRLRNTTIEEFIRRDTNLLQLLRKCGNRYHVFNNECMTNSDQVTGLLEKINMLLYNNITQNKGTLKMIISFVQRFAKPIIGGVLGAAVGGLAGGVIGAVIGLVVGCAVGEVWRR